MIAGEPEHDNHSCGEVVDVSVAARVAWPFARNRHQPIANAASERSHRAGQRRATLHAAMSNVLKIVRFGSVIEPRGRDGGDLHPVSAVRAREDEARKTRRGDSPVFVRVLCIRHRNSSKYCEALLDCLNVVIQSAHGS
jgi:hypothetical protein